MGKKRRLNRLITKWIKSELPEDHSTVLLLGVTRIPTSPTPSRRLVSRKSSFVERRRPGSVRRNRSIKENGRWPQCVATASDTSTAGAASAVMERSVDSIGACSLDVDGSVADVPGCSEHSSVVTLRSASPAISPDSQPHLPSYLSLACTVSGYSPTTNYDPDRLARSRDASPHRLTNERHPQPLPPVYAVRNNLLSPPNVVPLPQQHAGGMEQQRTVIRREFMRSDTTTLISRDSVDACYTLSNGHAKFVSEHKSFINGTEETKKTATQTETKSFIQQRVERLYGPGALAQGFFISKRIRDGRLSECACSTPKPKSKEVHSKSMRDDLLNDERGMKQSSSSPALPVLRHLRPEFRAQLPMLMSPKRTNESTMQKSITIPVLKEEAKSNGYANNSNGNICMNGNRKAEVEKSEKSEECNPEKTKDGHHFLKVLDGEVKRLLVLAEVANRDLEEQQDLPEEAKGKLRSVAGKAQLLTSQKMQQFKGLCTKNINQCEGEEFPTTNEDLQGFWDMVLLQVDQVDALFRELDELRANGWNEPIVEKASPPKTTAVSRSSRKPKPKSSTSSAAADEAKKQRELLRKQALEARRKAMRENRQQAEGSVEIFVPEQRS